MLTGRHPPFVPPIPYGDSHVGIRVKKKSPCLLAKPKIRGVRIVVVGGIVKFGFVERQTVGSIRLPP